MRFLSQTWLLDTFWMSHRPMEIPASCNGGGDLILNYKPSVKFNYFNKHSANQIQKKCMIVNVVYSRNEIGKV